MRRAQVYFYLSLLSLLLLLSCSKFKELDIRFTMEKAFFKAEKARQTLLVNPQAAGAGDYQKVIDTYRNVIKMLPSSSVDTTERKQTNLLAGLSQLRIADIYLLQNNPSQAIVELRKVLSDYPHNSSQAGLALFKMGRIYEMTGDSGKALESYHLLLNPSKYPPIIADNKPNLDLLAIPLNLVLISRDEKEAEREFENAKNYYLQVIKDYPDLSLGSVAKFNLARTYQLRGDSKEAIRILETLEDSSGRVPAQILMEIGDIYLSASDTSGASLAFQKVISTYPADSLAAWALLKIGYITFQQKNYSGARETLLKIAKQFPKQGGAIVQAHYLIAQTYEKEGKWDRAVNEFEWISTNLPTTIQSMEVPLHIASYYQKQGDSEIARTYFDKAMEKYQKLVEEHPKTQTEILALKYIAKCYTQQSRWEDGIRALQKLIDKYPKTGDAFEALLTQATIFEQKLHQKNKAKEIYSEILTRFPKHPSTPQIRTKMNSL